MADGPRCARRKQANPRRNDVSTFSPGVAAGSDSDDEDKLHIVEVEEEGSVPDHEGTLPGNQNREGPGWEPVREECVSEDSDALVEEMLQQSDTAVIFPEAPEDLGGPQHTPEAPGQDENGTPDAFSQLLTCPYCSRGYKRYTSLKEHIKYRHEKSEDNFSCSHCSYTFAYRTQLERHMAAHKLARDQFLPQVGVNRKFKCTECGKAFKYKHHLKEHLRIHSGEKPYECSNCKKRFSHSGSYSSHISSKKCVSVVAVGGRPRPAGAKAQSQEPPHSSPTPPPGQARDKSEPAGKPLQEQLPLNQIKTEPLDYEYKPGGGVFAPGGVAAGPLQGAVQAVVLPAVGLVSPISINLADLQNMFKVAVDGNVIRQVLENNAKAMAAAGGGGGRGLQGLPHGQQLISAISLPIVGQDGNAKIIINYSLDPSQAQLQPQNLKKEPPSPPRGSLDGRRRRRGAQKLPEDLTVARGPPVAKGDKEALEEEEEEEEEGRSRKCLLCDSCPAGMEALHALRHCEKDGPRPGGGGPDRSEPAVAALLAEGALCCEPRSLLALLKAFLALTAEPTADDLARISDSVSLPAPVVRRLFDKMQEAPPPPSPGALTPPAEKEDPCESKGAVSLVPGPRGPSGAAQGSPAEATPAEAGGPHGSPPASPPSPLNLTAEGPPAATRPPRGAEGPLDLSLPKSGRDQAAASAGRPAGEEPLNLSCVKKEPCTAYVGQPGGPRPLGLRTARPPALVAVGEQGRTPCLSSRQAIVIPQLAYTYATAASSPAGSETVRLNGIKEERMDPGSEGGPGSEEPNDSDSGPSRKKMKKMEGGVYACDLCDKIFQKSSSLLRHKYEHTGKRPHECSICSKAFKHKHHLIEHMRLHSGEKPYACDKCGKRFSHSGSYSQHMNHRYSYCKKEASGPAGGLREEQEEEEEEEEVGAPGGAEREEETVARETEERTGEEERTTPSLSASQLDSDERGSSAREDEESEEEGEPEEQEEEELPPPREGEGSEVDMDDIQVVQIGDEGDEEEEEEEQGEGDAAVAGERENAGRVAEEQGEGMEEEGAPGEMPEGREEEEEVAMEEDTRQEERQNETAEEEVEKKEEELGEEVAMDEELEATAVLEEEVTEETDVAVEAGTPEGKGEEEQVTGSPEEKGEEEEEEEEEEQGTGTSEERGGEDRGTETPTEEQEQTQ